VRVLYLTGTVVVLDQITKLLVKGFSIPFLGIYHGGMMLGESRAILGDFFRLTFVENSGMAFGIDVGGQIFIALFSILASAGIAYYLYRIRNEALVIRLALALILAGAIGNLIDRTFYGAIFGQGTLFHGNVVDFLDVDFFDLEFLNIHITRWPVFNIADASVTSGVLLMLAFHRRFAQAESVATESTETVSEKASDPVHPAS
jgi:signal peptidase II